MELIQGCLKGDRRCQNALYKSYFPLMSSIALRYSSTEEDALQHINYGFLKALNNLHTYKSEFAFATWLRHVLINHIIDENRKNKKFDNSIYVEHTDDMDYGLEVNLGEQKLEEKDVLGMLRNLPEATRKVFALFAVDGYKHNEISEMLGISEGTSKWHVNDARKKLMEMLNKESQVIKAC